MAKPAPVTSALAPDLELVRRFILDMLSRGAIAELVAAVIALLARMRDLNTELMAKIASKSRKRPPNESLRRLQLELPLFMTPAANDDEPAARPERERKKRGPKNRHRHGRPKLPAHLLRVPEVHRVPAALRMCPNCNVEVRTIGFKTLEKLDIQPAQYIVLQQKFETAACQKCHDYFCTCPRTDEVLDRGILGNELLVQALVDHYDDAVPWERMARRARGGCNAHARRKLVEALRLGDARATAGIELYAKIFHVDAESKRLGESIQRRFERRQRESAPLVAELKTWVDARRADVEPKSALGGALKYIHRQWRRLTAFLHDPLMELTNNEVERDLRRWVLNRKTWLFVGHEKSARRAAAALSLLATCRKMGIEPRRYLRETLTKILDGEKDLHALLPETFARKLAEQDRTANAASAA